MNHDHETLRARIDDHVDGTLTADARAELEAHLAGCGECRAELAAQRELRAAAEALPREIAPPRDLWAGIAARIEARPPLSVEPPAAPAPIDLASRRRVTLPWWSGIAAAAAAVLLVALSSGVTLLLSGDGAGGPVAARGPEPGIAAERAPTALAAFEPTERELGGALETLVGEFEARRHLLAPETVATVEESLRVIDRAIDEATAALAADPNNADLPLLLTGVYRAKMELLQTAADLPART